MNQEKALEKTLPPVEKVTPSNPVSQLLNNRKTIIGAVLLSVVLADQIHSFMPDDITAFLMAVGGTVFGVGFSHKLDKGRAAVAAMMEFQQALRRDVRTVAAGGVDPLTAELAGNEDEDEDEEGEGDALMAPRT